MAAITRRESGKWEARVRRKGGKTASRTFTTKAAAAAWAREQELSIEQGAWVDSSAVRKLTVGALLDDYTEHVAIKRASAPELGRLRYLAETLGHYRLEGVTPAVLVNWRDDRLREVSPATVGRELGLLGGVFSWARKERLIPLPQNPVAAIVIPNPDDSRNRRLVRDEEARLLAAMESQATASGGAKRQGNYRTGTRQAWLKPLVELALETAMRQGEILSLDWSNAQLDERTVYLPKTKNGTSRSVPLSTKAVQVLDAVWRLAGQPERGRVFPITADALKKSWTRSVRRARDVYVKECAVNAAVPDGRLLDLRFHDLRHEATSRLADKLPNLVELAAVTGHKDLRMLKRYYHPKASDLALKLG